MTSNFFKSVYLLMRLLAFMCLVGCGSVQTINGVKVKNKPDTKPNYAMYVGTFFFGFYFFEYNMGRK